MREYQVTKLIDGENYTITTLPPTMALKLLTRLVKLIGEPMSMLYGDSEAKVASVLPKAVNALAMRLNEDEVLGLTQELLKGVLYRGQNIQFELHFQGRLGHLFKVLGATLEVQYGDFLGVMLAAGGSPQASTALNPA